MAIASMQGTDQLDATETISVATELPTPTNPGFALASPSAIKLLLVLRYLAGNDQNGGSCQQIGALSGLSDRTVSTTLHELEVLGWVRVVAARGIGIRFTLLEPSAALKCTAREYYGAKIEKARGRLDQKEQELKKAEYGSNYP
jgi:DNA-binding HxlR family transcriptional regulator